MDTSIIVALITGGLAFLGSALTVWSQTSKTHYRIEQLEKKQDKHNQLIERMYKAEEQISLNKEQIKVANHRIEDLERK